MNRGKRLDIQALRAIAVLAVVIYHLWPGRLTGGFMGVDIFFVISGYLMTITLMRDAKPVLKAKKKLRETWTFLTTFYARRIKRLVPAAATTLLATLGLVTMTGNLSLVIDTAKQIVTSALFVQNWQLANESVDYLANTDPTAVQHFWSLSLEEQFYLAWPLLLLVILLLTVNLFVFYKKRKVLNVSVVPVIILIAGFFAYGYHLTQTDPSVAYFVTPARVWELLLGALIAFLPALKNYDLRLLLPWTGTAMIAYALYKWDGANFPGWHALVPTIGTALIIYAGTLTPESKWSFEKILRFKPIQWIGNLSYSLYLWHWPLIILLPALLFIDIDAHPYSIAIKLGILVLSFILAHLSYRYIEQSTQHLKLRKWHVYSGFIVVTALVAGLAFYAIKHAEGVLLKSADKINSAVLDDSDKCVGAKSIFNNCDKSFGFIDEQNTQNASIYKYDYLLSNKTTYSMVNGLKEVNKNVFAVGDLESKKEITIWGDSHAHHWINPFDKIGRENNIKFNIVTTTRCLGTTPLPSTCAGRFNEVKKTGVFDRSEAIIVSVLYDKPSESKSSRLSKSIDILRTLTDNKNIFAIEDVPLAGASGGPNCNTLRQSCKNDVIKATDKISQDSADIASAGIVPLNKIIAVKDIFCDAKYCYSNIGGVPVYRDLDESGANSHLTPSFAYSTWPILEHKFKEAGVIK